MKQTISLSKYMIFLIFISLIISFLTIKVLNIKNGQLLYTPEASYLRYETYFGSIVEKDYDTYDDVEEILFNYDKKKEIEYTFSNLAVFKDFDKFLLFGLIIFAILYVFSKYKFIFQNGQFDNLSKKNEEVQTQTVKEKIDIITLKNIENLDELKEKGILTEEEFEEKVSKIRSEKADQDLKKSPEFKQLKSLFDNEVLTKDEFEDKIKILKTISNKPIEFKKNISDSKKCLIIINHKKTSFDKDLGYYKTFEVLSNNKNLDKFMFNSKYEEELFFLKDNFELGYFDSVVDLIKKVKGIDVIIDD